MEERILLTFTESVMIMTRYLLVILCLPFLNSVILADFSNEWLIKSNLSQSKIIKLAQRHGLQYLEQLSDNVHVLIQPDIPRSSKIKQGWMAKTIRGWQKNIQVTQMKWRKRYPRTVPLPKDSKWNDMWYLNGNEDPDMQVKEAWTNGFSGKGVTIAIIDDGVEYTHIDLKANYNSRLSDDVYGRDKDPSPENRDSHGTHCAGVAAAVKNNICVIGTAYNANFAAIRLIGPNGATAAGEASALSPKNYGNDAVAIYSNSWGGTEGTEFEGPDDIVQNALINGIRKNRIYVWAGGNGGPDDNCNCDGYVNSIFTIGVNSVSKTHGLLSFSEPCSAIITSTFSGESTSNSIWTTDIHNGCMSQFSGTSAATPMAAGIIALALEANPSLTWRDVQHIVIRSSNNTALKYGEFEKNGAGLLVSDWYGFGLLNALVMTNLAKNWKLVPRQQICDSGMITENKAVLANQSPHLAMTHIRWSGCKESKVSIRYLEHVEVSISFEFSLRGALQFSLESPSGKTSKLLTRRNYDIHRNSQQQWTFMTVQHWGENPDGVWKLTMSLYQDRTETATLKQWKLTLYGTETDPSLGRGNETYEEPNYNVPNNTHSSNTRRENQSGSNKTITIVAIVIGCTAAVVVIICVCVGIRDRLKRKRKIKENNTLNISVSTIQIPPASTNCDTDVENINSLSNTHCDRGVKFENSS